MPLDRRAHSGLVPLFEIYSIYLSTILTLSLRPVRYTRRCVAPPHTRATRTRSRPLRWTRRNPTRARGLLQPVAWPLTRGRPHAACPLLLAPLHQRPAHASQPRMPRLEPARERDSRLARTDTSLELIASSPVASTTTAALTCCACSTCAAPAGTGRRMARTTWARLECAWKQSWKSAGGTWGGSPTSASTASVTTPYCRCSASSPGSAESSSSCTGCRQGEARRRPRRPRRPRRAGRAVARSGAAPSGRIPADRSCSQGQSSWWICNPSRAGTLPPATCG